MLRGQIIPLNANIWKSKSQINIPSMTRNYKKKNKINQIRQNKGNNEDKSRNQWQLKQTINNINEAGSSKRQNSSETLKKERGHKLIILEVKSKISLQNLGFITFKKV